MTTVFTIHGSKYTEAIYFSFSFIRDENKWENEASCYYPIMHMLKYDTRVLVRLQVLYYPLLFLFNYNMALLGVIFPHLFLSLINEKLKYLVLYNI